MTEPSETVVFAGPSEAVVLAEPSEALVASYDGLPWYRAITWKHWAVMLGAWGVWTLEFVDFLTLTFVLTDIGRTFSISVSDTSLLLLATYSTRWLGGLLFGSLSDRIGRKLPLLIALAWFTIFSVLTGLAPSFIWIIVCRLLLGFGMAPAYSMGATLVAETWPIKYRSIGLGITNTGTGVGSLCAGLAYGFIYPLTGWRGLFFVGVIPAVILGTFIIFCVSESPIWRPKTKPQSWADYPAVTLFRDYPRVSAYLAVLMCCLFVTNWPMLGLFPTYLRSLHFPVTMIATLTATAGIGQVVGNLVSGLIAQGIGRRLGLVSMLIGGAFAVLLMTVVIHHFFLAVAATFVGSGLLIGSAGVWGTILAENLPTGVRATGIGFLNNVGGIAGGMAPFIVLSTARTLGLNLGTTLAGCTVFAVALAVVVTLFGRETKGVLLTDIK